VGTVKSFEERDLKPVVAENGIEVTVPDKPYRGLPKTGGLKKAASGCHNWAGFE